jgi:tRNA 2-selenouridine synthase
MPTRSLAQTDDFRRLFLDDVPLLDVRAPVEFTAGAFPQAENHPLIDDAERHEIGITYKEDGQDAAISLGEMRVRGAVKSERVARWQDYLERHPDAVLYCFRGGMRSRIAQQWLYEATGLDCPRVTGGYKALRRFLIDELKTNGSLCRPVVVGGRTGVGKTRLLVGCTPAIDLERLAHHRGSAFGRHPQPQPTQIDFENAVSIALLKRVAGDNRPFLVEDESRNIGSRHVPPELHERMQSAPLVLLEATEEERIGITLQEYVHDALAGYQRAFGVETGFEKWADSLRSSLDRIRKRLGGERHARALDLLETAIASHRRSDDTSAHRAWIALLLHDYYDDMYNYQLERKADRIVFRGAYDAVCEYIAEHYGIRCDKVI